MRTAASLAPRPSPASHPSLLPSSLASHVSSLSFPCSSRYVDPDSINFGKMDVLFLAGHDAFRCFAVLTIPVFYLNMHGRRRRMPGLLPSVLGISIVWLFVWYAAAR